MLCAIFNQLIINNNCVIIYQVASCFFARIFHNLLKPYFLGCDVCIVPFINKKKWLRNQHSHFHIIVLCGLFQSCLQRPDYRTVESGVVKFVKAFDGNTARCGHFVDGFFRMPACFLEQRYCSLHCL